MLLNLDLEFCFLNFNILFFINIKDLEFYIFLKRILNYNNNNNKSLSSLLFLFISIINFIYK